MYYNNHIGCNRFVIIKRLRLQIYNNSLGGICFVATNGKGCEPLAAAEKQNGCRNGMIKKKALLKIASVSIAACIVMSTAFAFAAQAKDTGTDTNGQVVTSQTQGAVTSTKSAQVQRSAFAQNRTYSAAMATYSSKNDSAASTSKSSSESSKAYQFEQTILAEKQAATTTAKAETSTTKETTTTVKPEEKIKLAKPVILPEKTYDTDYTHPYNKQTNQIKLHWQAVKGASKYMVYIKNGKYTNWTNIVLTSLTECTVTGLNRDTLYAFTVKALDENGNTSDVSDEVSIKTARMDYSAADWQAMCRIVYHEVGGAAGSMWDRPIVYVADCVTNQYVCAKYTHQGVWPNYYKNYSSISSIIYTSGGFLSDIGLTSRGAIYSKVTQRVKNAVWGATYGMTYYNGIANDYNVFFWCNSAYARNDSRIAYGFNIPWGGYMYIWREYWG